MGQLLNVPIADTDVQEFGLDHCWETLSECVIDGKLDTGRHLLYKKRSYEEARTQVAELHFGQSLQQVEEDEQEQQEVQQRHVHKKTPTLVCPKISWSKVDV